MRAWMPVWLVSLGMVGGVVLVSLSSVLAYGLAIVWAFALIPHAADYIRRHVRSPDGGDANGFDDAETHYWRITLR